MALDGEPAAGGERRGREALYEGGGGPGGGGDPSASGLSTAFYSLDRGPEPGTALPASQCSERRRIQRGPFRQARGAGAAVRQPASRGPCCEQLGEAGPGPAVRGASPINTERRPPPFQSVSSPQSPPLCLPTYEQVSKRRPHLARCFGTGLLDKRREMTGL